MPSGFQMLDAYNSMKEQIINEESEQARSDQKVPNCFPESLKEEQDFKMSQGLPQNFLGGLHSGTLFLEELHSPLSSSSPPSSSTSPQSLLTHRDAVSQYPGFLQYQTLSPNAAANLLNPTPSSASSLAPPVSSSSSSPPSARRTPPMPAAAGSVPFFNLVAGGGCTLSPSPSSASSASSSSSPSITVPVSVGQRSPDHQLAPSPTENLFNLDKPNIDSLYEDCPPLDGGKIAIKMEPGLYQCSSEVADITCAIHNNISRASEEDYYMLGEVGFGDEFLNLEMDRSFEDIYHLASQLNISCDPSDWTYQDSQKWVRYQLGRGGSGVDPHRTEEGVALFNMAGDILQRMTEYDFQWRATEPGGSFLYRELHNWTRAGRYLREHCHRPAAAETDEYERDPEAAFYWAEAPYPAASKQGHISPAPSLDSTCSGGSGSSSGGGGGQGYGTSPYGMQMAHESSNEDEGFFYQGRARSRQAFTQEQHHQHLPHQHQTTLPTTTHASFSPAPSALPMSSTSALSLSSPAARGAHPAAPQGPRTGRQGGKQTIHLWQFLKELLEEPESYNSCIKWTDRVKGVFKIEDSSRVACLWGRRKNRPAMNYDKLSRSVRQYYKKGIIKKTEHSKRLVYQFCPGYL